MYEVTNRKMLKGTRRVSDVERICQENHERRKLEEQIATSATPPRNDSETDCHGLRPRNDSDKLKVLRMACTACMMATGGGATFAGLGISMGHWPTVVLGVMIGVICLLTGTKLERRIEHG